MASPSAIVFFFDVDNTLIDHDQAEEDLGRRLEEEFGPQTRKRYFEIYEELRDEVGYADFLGSFERLWPELSCDQRLLDVAAWYLNYPFDDRLYPGALDALAHLGAYGPTVVLTDGEAVFQPRKVQLAGLYDAVGGRVLIYLHKVEKLDEIANAYPARHYVMVEDKLSILSVMKDAWHERVTTVLVRQGSHAPEPGEESDYPPADVTLDSIGTLAGYSLEELLGA
jgi:FMN phosphatase YigB (HAD superfamily)